MPGISLSHKRGDGVGGNIARSDARAAGGDDHVDAFLPAAEDFAAKQLGVVRQEALLDR